MALDPALDKDLETAIGEVAAAERALEELLRELSIAPRAEKVTVTPIVETAFKRLRAARAILAKVHGDPPPR